MRRSWSNSVSAAVSCRRVCSRLLLPAVAACLSLAPVRAQEDTPKGRTHYKGREIARTMHYAGAPWLVRERREREEECARLIRELGVQPGDVVCDFGCGNGFYTLRLAGLVGDKGKVLAVDIQKQMLALLRARAKKTDIGDRIETVLGTVRDPRLAPNSVDLVLMVDVYHELSHPVSVLRAIRKCLRPRGRIAVVEFRQEDPKVPIKPLHKMSKRQVLREIVPNGFRLVRDFDGLPWQHVMFFGRREEHEAQAAARAGMAKATRFARTGLAVHGGYAGIYSVDLERRFGESRHERAGPSEIWVQPPGTPSVGHVYLRAFRATGDDAYFVAARDVGRALAWCQRQAGGWDHLGDVHDLLPGSRRPTRPKGQCTFDDAITQGALTFLIELDRLVEERWLTDATRLGIRHLIGAQFDNGAWPQWYPLRGGYHDYYTFNDNAINDCIRVALLAADRYGRNDCRAAALQGGRFLVASRGEKPQSGWAQQYAHDMKPAAARAFEPAAMCSAVTARNVRTLTRLYLATGEAEFLAPIPDALDWLRRVRLENGEWARFYELRTDRPIYGDRDGAVHYTLAEISEERRKGYSWHGTWGIPTLARDHARLVALGAAGFRALADRKANTAREARFERARQRASQILARIDASGRIERPNGVYIADFVRTMNALCDCLDEPGR